MATIPLWVPPVTSGADLNQQHQASEQEFTIAGDGMMIPIAYGTVQIKGKIKDVFHDSDTGTWTFAVLWCWGEIDSFVQLLINGATPVSGVTVTHYRGTTSQTADATLTAALGSTYPDDMVVTNEHGTIGIAYSVIQYTDDKYTGLPEFVAEIKGRKVFDDRDVTQTLGDRSTWKWSSCPAVCQRDLMTESFFGPGLSVNQASVDALADIDDDDTLGEARRQIDLVIDRQQPFETWRKIMDSYSGGWSIKRGSEWILVPDRPRSTDWTITDSTGGDILDLEIIMAPPPPTHVRIWYTDTTEPVWRERFAEAELTGVSSGTVPRVTESVKMPGITRFSQAQREATERLKKLQRKLQAIVTLPDDFVGAEVGDVFSVTSKFGLTNVLMRAIDMPNESRVGRPQIRLHRYSADDYDDSLDSEVFLETSRFHGVVGTPPATIGAKINYTSFTSANSGEVYIHGFTATGVAQDIDAIVNVNGVQTTVPKGTILTSQAAKRGWIAWDADQNDAFNGLSMALVWNVAGQWYYDNNTTAVTFSLSDPDFDNLYSLGTLETGSADQVLSCSISPNAVPLKHVAADLSSLDSTANAKLSGIAEGATASHGINYLWLEHSDFDLLTTATNWVSASLNGVPAISTDLPRFGSKSIELTNTAGAGTGCYLSGNGVTTGYHTIIPPGRRWIVSCWVASDDLTTQTWYGQLQFPDASFLAPDNPVTITGVADEFQQMVFVLDASATTWTSCRVRLFSSDVVQNSTVYIDNVSLVDVTDHPSLTAANYPTEHVPGYVRSDRTIDVLQTINAPAEAGATLGGQLGTNITDEDDVAVASINAKNRFTGRDYSNTDPYFADADSTAWSLGGDWERIANGEYTGAPAMEIVGQTDSDLMTAATVDQLLPGAKNDVVKLVARVNTNNIDGISYVVMEYDSDGAYLSTQQSLWLAGGGAWETISTEVTLAHDRCHYYRAGINYNGLLTVGVSDYLRVQWLKIGQNLVTGATIRPLKVSVQPGFGPHFTHSTFGGGLNILSTNESTLETGSGDSLRLNSGTGVATLNALDLSIVGNISSVRDVLPTTTELYDLGSASKEWDNIYVENAVTVSDPRTKNDLGALDDRWITFLESLSARLFSKKDVVIPPSSRQEWRPTMEEVEVEMIVMEDGEPKLDVRREQRPVMTKKVVLDAEGQVVIRDGSPLVVDVPVGEFVEVAEDERVIAHGRPHTGFMADAVRQALTDAGIDDWAGYAYDQDNDRMMLRLLEFIGPLVLGYQSLSSRIRELETS